MLKLSNSRFFQVFGYPELSIVKNSLKYKFLQQSNKLKEEGFFTVTKQKLRKIANQRIVSYFINTYKLKCMF